MPSTTMPPGGGFEVNGLWYTPAEWQAMGGAASLGLGGGSQSTQTIDGKQILAATLQQFGLTGLDMNTVWQQYVNSGSNLDYLLNTWLPTTTAFKTAFPAWDVWSKQGHTVAQYVDYKNTVISQAHAAGFPDGTVDNDTITAFINGGVSAQEAQQRIVDAGRAANQLDTNSQAYLMKNELGLSDGDLASIFFNPKTALPLLENKLAAAQIGGAAANAGMDLATTTADQLAKLGVTQGQAAQGFSSLAQSQQLLGPLPGQQGSTLTQDQAVQGVFGANASAAQQLKKTAAQRQAVFQQGGGFTTSNTGVTGAGVSKGV